MPGQTLHMWVSEEPLPIEPKDSYNRMITPVTLGLNFFADAWLIDEYSADVHAKVDRFKDEHVGSPYFRFLGVYSRSQNIRPEHWDTAFFTCWGRAGILCADRGPLHEQLIRDMNYGVKEGNKSAACLAKEGEIPSVPDHMDYVAWVNQRYLLDAEKAAEEVGLEVIMHESKIPPLKERMRTTMQGFSLRRYLHDFFTEWD